MSGKCCVCNDQCLIYSIQIRACLFSKLTAAAVRSCVWSVCMNVGRRGVRAEDCGEQGFEPPTHPCTCSNRAGVGEWENVVSILAVQKNDESLSLQTKRRSPDPGSWPRNFPRRHATR